MGGASENRDPRLSTLCTKPSLHSIPGTPDPSPVRYPLSYHFISYMHYSCIEVSGFQSKYETSPGSSRYSVIRVACLFFRHFFMVAALSFSKGEVMAYWASYWALDLGSIPSLGIDFVCRNIFVGFGSWGGPPIELSSLWGTRVQAESLSMRDLLRETLSQMDLVGLFPHHSWQLSCHEDTKLGLFAWFQSRQKIFSCNHADTRKTKKISIALSYPLSTLTYYQKGRYAKIDWVRQSTS